MYFHITDPIEWEGATNFPVAIWFRGRSMIQLLASSRVSGRGFAVQHKATQAGLRRQLSIQPDGGHLDKVAADEAGQRCSVHDDGSVPTSEPVASSIATEAHLSSSNVNINNTLS
jgi:hypothetical protein